MILLFFLLFFKKIFSISFNFTLNFNNEQCFNEFLLENVYFFIKFDFDSENVIVNVKNNENKNNFASSKGFNHIKEKKKPITEQKVNEKLMPLETEKKIMRIIIYITI
jgi:hypothetical protein